MGQIYIGNKLVSSLYANDIIYDDTTNIRDKIEGIAVSLDSLKETVSELVIDSGINYVTPEMFGAIGDGVSDDSQAIQRALEVGVPVYFGDKVYSCKNIITKNIPHIHMKGTGKSVIKWGITTTEGFRKYCAMISDDDYEHTPYLDGGNILIEDMIFDGNGKDITSFPVKDAFGLCAFYNRTNVTVRNSLFTNCHSDGLSIRGLQNKLDIDGTTFSNLGLWQDGDGTRNGFTVTRTYWDRDEAINKSSVNPLFVDVKNCVFKNIADECLRADGITCLTVDNCEMEDIGHFILETGHQTDETKFVHTLSNCVGNNIALGLYCSGADGGGPFKYDGKIKIQDCHFTNLGWTGCPAVTKRSARSYLISCWTSSDIQPEVFIENSTIKGGNYEPEDYRPDEQSTPAPTHFIGGSSIYLKNTKIYYKTIYTLGVFTFSNKMIVEDCDITIDRNVGMDYYVLMPENGKLIFKNTDLRLKYIYNFIRCDKQNVNIIFEDCSVIHNDSSYIFLLFSSNQTGANIKFNDNIFTGKLTGRFIQAADSEVKVNKLNIVNNLFPWQYNGWGTISNLTSRQSNISGNLNYNN